MASLGRALGSRLLINSSGILGADPPGLNLLSAAASDFETGMGGWGDNVNASVAMSTAEALHGTHSLAVTAVATATVGGSPANLSIFNSNFIAVSPNTQYTMLASFYTPAGNRQCVPHIHWCDSSKVLISESLVTVSPPANQWAQGAVTAVSPSNAAFAELYLYFLPTSGFPINAGAVNYVDCISLALGSSLTWGVGN